MSIHQQHISSYEIIVAGISEPRNGVTYIPMVTAAREGRTNLMRNAAASTSRFDRIVFLDDDIFLTSRWLSGVERYADADLLSTRILSLDGTRTWDWATSGGPGGLLLLNYDEIDPFMYLPGGLLIVQAFVWELIRWDERIGYGEGEDVVFSRAAFRAGFRSRRCKESVAIHNDHSRTQIGRKVVRRSADGASTWLTNALKTFDADQLARRGIHALKERRIAEAVDCFRYALHKRPDYSPVRQLLMRIEHGCGGPVDSGEWHPMPII